MVTCSFHLQQSSWGNPDFLVLPYNDPSLSLTVTPRVVVVLVIVVVIAMASVCSRLLYARKHIRILPVFMRAPESMY
jgi:hypothetical protein